MSGQELNIHQDLIEGCRTQNQKAQHQIYNLYHKAMYNTALRIINDETEAEDILQDSFTSVFRNIHQYRQESSFGAWIKRIVVNHSLTALKSKQKTSLMMAQVGDEQINEVDFEEIELTVDRIKRAMQDLPTGFRTVLSLYLFEGYDHLEIAEILGVTVSTSKSQLNRAKTKIKELLKSEVKYG